MKEYKVRIEVLYIDETVVMAENEEEAKKQAMDDCDEVFELIQDISITEVLEVE